MSFLTQSYPYFQLLCWEERVAVQEIRMTHAPELFCITGHLYLPKRNQRKSYLVEELLLGA